jgi:hypothetical protein
MSSSSVDDSDMEAIAYFADAATNAIRGQRKDIDRIFDSLARLDKDFRNLRCNTSSKRIVTAREQSGKGRGKFR